MKGVKRIFLDGEEVEKIPIQKANTIHRVEVIMGEKEKEREEK